MDFQPVGKTGSMYMQSYLITCMHVTASKWSLILTNLYVKQIYSSSIILFHPYVYIINIWMENYGAALSC